MARHTLLARAVGGGALALAALGLAVAPGACGGGTAGAGGGGAAHTSTSSPPLPTACGDGQCAGGESCLSCPEDCDACAAGCGDGQCAGAETCDTCPADCCDPLVGCGDGLCASDEGCAACPTDCGACTPGCGDGVCDVSETCAGCPADCCAPTCGDDVCGPGEACDTCPADCGACPVCGDSACGGGETCGTCALDCGSCPASCGDGQCSGGETCGSCPGDCGACAPACGNGACDAGETCSNCPADCGACPLVCGDGNCDPGETQASCASDCGYAQATCGDGGCNGDETCRTCRADCGACDESDALAKCAFDPMQWWSGAGSRDITFAAFGDSHALDRTPGCGVNAEAGADQAPMRQAINTVGQHVWPGGQSFYKVGKKYDHLRGAIIVGDLTDSGSEPEPSRTRSCLEYTSHRRSFGRCGDEGLLNVPVYDLYGNHDFPWNAMPGDVTFHPVIDYLAKIKAAHRPGDAQDLYDDPDPTTGHYAFRWDDIWFVNLDVKPGTEVEVIDKRGHRRMVDPHGSIAFLKSFLLSRSTSAKRQIVLLAHYPLNTSRIADAERLAFCRTIHHAQHAVGDFSGGQKLAASWPVMAYVHGHTHHPPEHHDFKCPAPYDALKIPHFNAGTPLWGDKSAHPKAVEFTLFRIGTTKLEVVGVRASAKTGAWGYVYKERLGYPAAP